MHSGASARCPTARAMQSRRAAPSRRTTRGEPHRGTDVSQGVLRHGSRVLPAVLEHLEHAPGLPTQGFAFFLNRSELGDHAIFQPDLALTAGERSRAAIALDVGTGRAIAQRLMHREYVADFGTAGVAQAELEGIRESPFELLFHGFWRVEEVDGVALRFAHLALAIEAHDARRGRKHRLRLWKDFAETRVEA